jgi:hypothetical protein
MIHWLEQEIHRKYHEVSQLFPLMQGEEFEQLKADIATNGLREANLSFLQEQQLGLFGHTGNGSLLAIEPSMHGGFWFVTKIEAGTAEGLTKPILGSHIGSVFELLGVSQKEYHWNIRPCPLRDRSPYLVNQKKKQTLPKRVYFIKGGGLVKIGVAFMPKWRMEQLQTLSPVPLTLLAIAPGGYKFEAELHHRFAKSRVHGEWFKPSKELYDIIEEYKI